jgi:Ca-activated chloride channel family protein
MTARVPGTEAVVDGVRLLSHEARVLVRDGFARTEIVEEFQNDTDRVLEGRYVFRLPPRASISRLALWVGDKLVEGEVVERDRAARIFKGIVDDTVRPRDPALLEWVSGAEFSLKIFPIEAKKSRRVLIAYNEVLSTETPVLTYVHPLSLGDPRATPIGRFRIEVDVEAEPATIATPLHEASVKRSDARSLVTFEAKSFVPRHDFVVEMTGHARVEPLALHVPGRATTGFPELAESSRGAAEGSTFALRVRATLPEGMNIPAAVGLRRVIVVDRSASQTKETLDAQARMTVGLLQRMSVGERFALLGCDTDCVSFPEAGMSELGASAVDGARAWLGRLETGGGTDLAQALTIALRRLEGPGGQIVMLGDGSVSAGDLDAAGIAERIAESLQSKKADLRLIGAGVSVDEVLLGNVARMVGATYEPLGSETDLDSRVETVASHLRTPVLAATRLELPDGFSEVHPPHLPNLRLGEEIVVTGKLRPGAGGTARLVGRLGDGPYARAIELSADDGSARSNPLVPRLWAEARIAALQAGSEADAKREIVRLSRHYHVMSRHTAMLVLENERMFAEFGIERTQPVEPSTPARHAAKGQGGERPSREVEEGLPSDFWGTGDAFGAGSLGLSGVGEGGGGRGEGIGMGMGTWGSGAGRSSHKTSPPQVRGGATNVSGRLAPELIQRIVRSNYGRFRLCYEQGLVRNPSLEGRVVVRFIIDQSGSVAHATNSGSTLPDSQVVQCVVQAFPRLSFPEVEGGTVTVVYPILFSPGDAPPSPAAWAIPEPIQLDPAVHRAQDDSWRQAESKHLETLRAAVQKDDGSRRAHARLVRGLLQRGKFDEALAEARRFAGLDPDLSIAHELLAHAEAASGNGPRAVAAIAWLAEGQPRSSRAQVRAAQAYEALGDERRACSHWRAAAELLPKDELVRYEAVRCTGRVRNPQDALVLARAIDKPGEALLGLIALLEKGEPLPAYDPGRGRAGSYEATVTCAPEHDCPVVIILAPDGTVHSPWTPDRFRAGRGMISFQPGVGTYRAILIGKGDAKLVLRAHGVSRTFDVAGEGTRTVAATDLRRARLRGW